MKKLVISLMLASSFGFSAQAAAQQSPVKVRSGAYRRCGPA